MNMTNMTGLFPKYTKPNQIKLNQKYSNVDFKWKPNEESDYNKIVNCNAYTTMAGTYGLRWNDWLFEKLHTSYYCARYAKVGHKTLLIVAYHNVVSFNIAIPWWITVDAEKDIKFFCK